MGAREELLAAARSLIDGGATTFSPAQLIAAARSRGCAYPDTTLRTFIVGPMCINSPDHHAVQYGDFERVGRGSYRFATGSRSSAPVPTTRPALDPDPSEVERSTSIDDVAPTDASETQLADRTDWFWEGNVQSMVVGHLASTGWRVRRVADTASRQTGVDIEADRRGERLLIEVKGYPATTYAHGDRRGQPKATSAATQARTYFGNALLTGLLMRADHAHARVALAFPDLPTFRNLGDRVASPLAAAAVEVWFVSQDGIVTEPPVAHDP